MQITDARITRDADVAAELQSMRALGPRKIIREVVDGQSQVLAVGESLIETDERIPGPVGIAYNAIALAGESVVKAVDQPRTDNAGVADGKAFAVIVNYRFGNSSGQEGFA